MNIKIIIIKKNISKIRFLKSGALHILTTTSLVCSLNKRKEKKRRKGAGERRGEKVKKKEKWREKGRGLNILGF